MSFGDYCPHEITALKFTRSGGVKIEIDGVYIGECDAAKFSYKAGDRLTDVQLEAVRGDARRFGARISAARSLAVQGYTKKGLVQRLRHRGIDADAAEEAARYYEDRGYVDDAAFAADRAQAMHSRKNYGRRRIYSELVRLGVPPDAAREATDGLPPDSEALSRALSRRRTGDMGDRRERERQWRHFVGQGFSAEDIRSAFAALAAPDDDIFEAEEFYDE